MDIDLIRNLNQQIKDFNDVLVAQTGKLANIASMISERSSDSSINTNKISKSIEDNTNSTRKVSSGMDAYSRALSKSTGQVVEGFGSFNYTTYHTKSAFLKTKDALLSGQEGFGKYNSAFSSMGNAISSATEKFGLVGKIFGFIAETGFTILAHQAKQADSLGTATDTISKLGAANGFSMEDIRKMGAGARLTSFELEKLTKPMQSVSGGFVALGGTQTEGIKRFGQLVNLPKDVRRDLRHLGLSDEERNQAMADFVSAMNASGSTFGGKLETAEGLQKAAVDYTTKMYELSYVTGKSVEQSTKENMQLREDKAVVMLEMEFTSREKHIQELKAQGTPESKRQAALEEEQVNNQKANLNKVITDLQKSAMTSTQKSAVLKALKTGVVDKDAEGLVVAGIDIQNYVQQFRTGTIKEGQFVDESNQKTQQLVTSVGLTVATQSEHVKKILGGEEGGKETAKTLTRALDNNRELQSEKAESETEKQKKTEDSLQKARDIEVETISSMRLAVDELEARVNPFTNGTFANLATIFADNVKYVNYCLGALAAAFSIGMFAKLFGRGKTGVIAETAEEVGGAASKMGTITKGLLGGGAAAGALYLHSSMFGDKPAEEPAEQTKEPDNIDVMGMFELPTEEEKKNQEQQIIDANNQLIEQRTQELASYTDATKKISMDMTQASILRDKTVQDLTGIVTAESENILRSVRISAEELSNSELTDINLEGLNPEVEDQPAEPKIPTVPKTPTVEDKPKTQPDKNIESVAEKNLLTLNKSIALQSAKLMELTQKLNETSTKLAEQEKLKALNAISKFDFDPEKVKINSEAVASYQHFLGDASKLAGIDVTKLADTILSFEEVSQNVYLGMKDFEKVEINSEKISTNSSAFVSFANAMASFTGYGNVKDTSADIAEATEAFMNYIGNFSDFIIFSHAPVGPNATKNAEAFISFSEAMSKFKGGPKLTETVSSLLGSKLRNLFGEAGPIEAFKSFLDEISNIVIDDNKINAFLNFSTAISLMSNSKKVKTMSEVEKSASISKVIGDMSGTKTTQPIPQPADSGTTSPAASSSTASDTKPITPSPGPDGKILDFIGKIESGGDYNKLVGGKSKNDPPLTSMTVKEVLDYQRSMIAKGHESTALGKYQVINKTLQGIVDSGTVKLQDTFDQTTQDRIALMLMKQRGKEKYQTGKLTVDQYANNLAKEWASLPMPDGRSYYSSVGSNKSLVSRNDFVQALKAKEGGLFSGPTTGYPMELHGTEMVIPQMSQNSLLMQLAQADKDVADMGNLVDMLDSSINDDVSPSFDTLESSNENTAQYLNPKMIDNLANKFDQAISILRNTDDVQDKIMKQTTI